MGRTRFVHVLALAAGLILAACSDAGTPTEATTPAEVHAGGPSFSMSAEAQARHEALKQELDARKAQVKAAREAGKESYEVAKKEWKAWKEDWKKQYQAQQRAWKREHQGEKGGPDIELLRCEPRPYDADVAIIGPNGGTLHVGESQLVIPKGALNQEQLITMEAPTSSLVDVRFEPHGLEFKQSAQLKLSYKGCVRPTSADLLVAYLDQGNRVLELPPSLDLRADDEVEADIDHFSRYAIAY